MIGLAWSFSPPGFASLGWNRKYTLTFIEYNRTFSLDHLLSEGSSVAANGIQEGFLEVAVGEGYPGGGGDVGGREDLVEGFGERLEGRGKEVA